MQSHLESGHLVPLLEPFKDIQRSSWLVYPDRAYVPSRVQTLIDYLVQAFAKDPCA